MYFWRYAAGDLADLGVVVPRDAVEHRLEDVVPLELYEGVDGELADPVLAVVERLDQRGAHLVGRALAHHALQRVEAGLRRPLLERALDVRLADLGGELHRDFPRRAEPVLLCLLEDHVEHGLDGVRLAPEERLQERRADRRICAEHGVEQRHHGCGRRSAEEQRAHALLDGCVGVREHGDEVFRLEPLGVRDGFEQRLLLRVVLECSRLERLERGLLPPDLVLHPVKHSRHSVHHAPRRGKRSGAPSPPQRTSTSLR